MSTPSHVPLSGGRPTRPTHGSVSASGARPAPPPPRVGRYVVTGELGRGGMGVVLRAHDPALRREVAIKMLHPGAGAGALQRFELEARAVARLHHPGIVAVHEVGAHDGRPFIVMDLVVGQSFEEYLGRGARSPRRVAELVREVALALDHAHGEGIVHRDVKPQNVLIDVDDRARLTDFGLARELRGAEATGITTTGAIVGTPSYMAPEQAGASRGAVDARTDVFALGGLLYRALAGRAPFEAVGEGSNDYAAVLRRVLLEDPEPIRAIDPNVHPDLETIAQRCLEKTPARRYRTADAVAEELRRFAAGEAIAARPPGRIDRARRSARRHPARAAGLAALVVVLVGAPVAGALVVRAGHARDRALDDARLRAAADERRELIDGAREGARVSLEAVAAARRALETGGGAGGATGGAEAQDRVLAEALRALQAASRYRGLAPDDPSSRRAAFDATVTLGEVAVATEQWNLATRAFTEAFELGVDDEAARAALDRVDAARAERDERRVAEVRGIIADARDGGLATRPFGHQEALFRLVALRDDATTSALGVALDGLTAEMRAARRGVLERGLRAGPGEAPLSEAEVSRARLALDALDAQRPGEALDGTTSASIDAISKRLLAHQDIARIGVSRAIVSAQTHALGAGGVSALRLCCEALGWTGRPDLACEALGRYLVVEQDEGRAVSAGLALCRLRGERAMAILRALRNRFGFESSLWRRLRRHLPREIGAVDVVDESAGAYIDRGISRVGIGDLDGAMADFRRASELDPSNPDSWSNAAQVRVLRGDFVGALADVDRALALAPEDAEILSNRGVVLWRLGELDRALADFDRAVALAPAKAGLLSNRAALRGALGDPRGALEDADRAVALDSVNPEVYVTRADLHRAAGRLREAIADFDAALAIDPDDAKALSNRGLLRSQAGDRHGALADLDRAVSIAPEDPLGWCNRGGVRMKVGDVAGAIADLEHFLKIAPDHGHAPVVRRHLDRLRRSDR